MSTSLMYHAFGLTGFDYKRTDYVSGNIMFHIYPKPKLIRCPLCHSFKVIKRGQYQRWVKTVPIGQKPVWLIVDVPRVECKKCQHVRRIDIQFADERRWYSRAFERHALALTQSMTMKDAAIFLGVGWDTIKDIKKKYLEKKFSKHRLKDLKYIAIDEISIRKNNKYFTIVMDLETGIVVYVGDGKDAEALDPFWKRLKQSNANIEGVAMDMSPSYISAVLRNLPGKPIVFDHFHVVKLMNEKLSKIRRKLHRELEKAGEKSVLKGLRWILLKNPENLDERKNEEERLKEALKMNEPLAIAYYMKEDLRQIWGQANKDDAKEVLDDWISRARASGVRMLIQMANTLATYMHGILAFYDHKISSGPLEGVNNKIKTMKRQAYGFRDKEFFKLRILGIHETKYALTG